MASLFRNAAWSGGVTGFRALAGLANALLAVRLVGVETYGHLAALLSVFVLYLSLNTSLYTVLVTRLMSLAAAKDRRSRAETLASTVVLTACSIAFLGMVTGVGFWMAPSFLGLSKFKDMGLAFLAMGLLVAVQIISALQAAIIEASGRLDLAMRAQLLGSFVVLSMLVFSLLLDLTLTGRDYLLMLCVAASVDLGLLWGIRRHRLQLLVWQAGASASVASLLGLFRSSGVLQATSLMNLFLEPLNKFLLNNFVGPVAVTTYDLAMKVIWGIQGLFGAAMRIFLHLAHLDGAAVGHAYRRAISLVATPVLIFHTLGAILLSFVAHRWVSIDAVPVMLFYAVATISNIGMIFIMPLYTSLISRGDLRFVFQSQAVLALINSVVSLVAIPFLGLVGAALGLLIATVYNTLVIYVRHGHFVGRLDGWASTVKQVAARFAATLLLFAVSLYFGLHGGIEAPVLIVLLTCLFILGITESLPRRILFGRTDESVRNRNLWGH